MKRRWYFVAVPLVAAVGVALSVPLLVRAQQPKIDICHLDGTGRYNQITIADPAYDSHLAHGDKDLGTFYVDADGDGFGSAADQVSGCTVPAGYVDNAGDCNDSDPSLNTDCLANACVEILLHCVAGSAVLETICGGGVHDLAPFTAANISYVRFLGDTNSVVLNHCTDSSTLSNQSLEIFADTNMCALEGGCCGNPRWNDSVCSIEIK